MPCTSSRSAGASILTWRCPLPSPACSRSATRCSAPSSTAPATARTRTACWPRWASPSSWKTSHCCSSNQTPAASTPPTRCAPSPSPPPRSPFPNPSPPPHRPGLYRGAQPARLRRSARRFRSAVLDHGPHRPRSCHPRRRQGKRGRQADGHRCRPCLRDELRHRSGLPRRGGLLSAAGLLRQPAGGRRLRARGLHHRRARRHGQLRGGAGRRLAGGRCRIARWPLPGRVARPDRHLRHLHRRRAVAPTGPVRSQGMNAGSRQLAGIALFAVLVGCVPLLTRSGAMLHFVMMALYATLIAQAWYILGGFGGQFSFGHALFFGTGAYIQAIAQLQGGINPWAALPMAMAGSALVGLLVGAPTFRCGLKGSYFALVTLAFAEVSRIVALSVSFTGGGVGLMLPLRESAGNLQFASRAGYLWVALAMVVGALLLTCLLRTGRFRACLQAVRDDEDAARAVGVNPLRVKLAAISLSAAFMGAAGAFYLQVFQYIDPGLAYGPASSVEALVGAIVGGMGTLWGPVLGAAVLHLLSDLTRNLFGALPGINMVIYGSALVLIVIFLPRGVAGLGLSVRQRWNARAGHND